jgi:hypothetical protein
MTALSRALFRSVRFYPSLSPVVPDSILAGSSIAAPKCARSPFAHGETLVRSTVYSRAHTHSLSLALSLPLSHTNTQTHNKHKHSHAHTHTTHTLPRTQMRTLPRTQIAATSEGSSDEAADEHSSRYALIDSGNFKRFYVCMYVCMYVSYVCTYTYVCMYACMYIYYVYYYMHIFCIISV